MAFDEFELAPRLLVLEEGEPLELLVVPTLFKGLFLLPRLARWLRPLLDILGVGVLTQLIGISKHCAEK